MSNKIVITGASSEIGQSICKKVVKPRDHVILQCFKNEAKCSKLKKKYTDLCEIVTVDFNNTNSVEKFCKQLHDIDILINVAGYTVTALLPDLKEKDIQKMINVNVIAIVKITKSVISGMVAKHKGCIVNISSITATRGNRGQTVYSGTKGFIESFSRSLAAEYGSRGIRINCVAPGPISTGSLKELLSYAPEEVKQSIVSNRLGKPEDVGSVVAFLCSKEAEFINGKCISVDGGFMKGV